MRHVVAAVLITLLTASCALGWSDAGHKIVGAIAYRQLTPDQQTKIVAALKAHPRWKEDFESRMPEDLTTVEDKNEWVFQQASIWPDMVRGFQREDRKYHHPTWHYLDIPVYLTPEDQTEMATKVKFNDSLDPPATQQEEMNAVQAIRLARRLLADQSTPDDQKAILLCWVFHLIGDIHQPLHSTAMVSKNLFPTGDRGGNSIKTDQRGNLHSVWDGFLGGRVTFRVPHNRAISITNDPELNKLGAAAATMLDEETWLNESHAAALITAYDDEVTGYLRGYVDKTEAPPIHLTERYLKAGGDVAEKRVTQAGYRLGEVLKQVIQEPNAASR